MKIELLEISGMVSALKALRLPYNKEPMSEIDYTECSGKTILLDMFGGLKLCGTDCHTREASQG